MRSNLGSGCGNGVSILIDERHGHHVGARGSGEGGAAMGEAVVAMPWQHRHTRLAVSVAMARVTFFYPRLV
jgi:hypothetical protein